MASKRFRQRQQHDKRQWCEPTDADRTGWPPGMLQDDSPELTRWLSSKPDARAHVRDVASQIDTTTGDLQQERIGEVEMHNV